jgi:hypothetical protein
METLQIGTSTKQVPSTWNELRRRQLLDVLAELYRPAAPDRRLQLLRILTGYNLPLLTSLDVDVLAQLLPLTDFLTSEDHLLTEQLLPTIGVPGRHFTEKPTMWHGPRAHLQNVLFGEFIFADTFFVLYCLHGTENFLDQFLTVLYRPERRGASPDDADWNGDVRQAFNEHQLEARTPRVRHVAALEKLAVLTWYRGCRTQLAQEFPDVFVAADEDATSRPNRAPDWSRVLRKLAGGAFGAVDQTAGQPVRLILAEMQDLATAKPIKTHA